MDALLDPGPANLIPMLVNIYQQQAQHAMAQPISLKTGNAERGEIIWERRHSVTRIRPMDIIYILFSALLP